MAQIEYVRTKYFDDSDSTKSVAIVSLNGVEMEIEFWYSTITVFGKDVAKTMILIDALFQAKLYDDAINLASISATGNKTAIYNGIDTSYEDTRNWAQKWIDFIQENRKDNKIVIDPLL